MSLSRFFVGLSSVRETGRWWLVFGIDIFLERLSAANNMTFKADLENLSNFTQIGFFCRTKFAPKDQ